MNKMAVFVEGYTELVFIDKLIREIATGNSVRIQWRRIDGGTTCRRRNHQIQAEGQIHFVVIHDCGGDDAVKTRMLQEYRNLAGAGYSTIICIRDVHDKFAYGEIPLLEARLPLGVPTIPIRVDFILSIMEIEAWFLSEHNHFPMIHPSITVPSIITALGFDPEHDDMQLRPIPTKDLNDCYAIGGQTYAKRNARATVDALDYEYLYVGLADRIDYLKRLCGIIETFLTS